MKIDSVHAEHMLGNAVSSSISSHSIVSRDSAGDIHAAGVSISGSSGTLFSYSDGTRSVYGGCNSDDPWFGTSSNHDLRLVTYGGERMRIDNTGNVGIGDTTPSYKLDVNGDINVASGKKFRMNGTALANSAMITASVTASSSTLVQRHSAGYIFANYFNTTPDDVASGVTKVCVETGNDGYIRHGTSAAISTFLGLANSATITATSSNVASNIVQRDSSGNFSAGTITAALSGNASTATNADKLDDVHLDDIFNNMGGAHNNRSDFDDVPDAGCYYITGSTNGPGVNSASQYYGFTLGLGGHDPVAEGSNNGKYGCQMYWGRNVSNPYINLRYLENGAWGTWRKAAAGYADSAGTATSATNADKVDNLHASAFLRTDTTSSTIGRLNVSGSSQMAAYEFWKAEWNYNAFVNEDDYARYFQVGVYVNRWVRGEGLLASSDERVKTDIQTLDTGMALSKLEKIRPVSYKMKDTGDFMFGFIGQEIEKELPNVVNKADGTITDFNIMGVFSNKQSIKYQAEDEEKDTFIYTLTLEEPIPSTFDVDKAILIEAETTGDTIQFFYDPEYCGKPEIGGTVMKLLSKESDNVKESARYKIIATRVNDFRSLDYNEIFTVTTAALKEVNEQLKAEKIKTADLTTRVEELEAMVSIIKLNMTWPDA